MRNSLISWEAVLGEPEDYFVVKIEGEAADRPYKEIADLHKAEIQIP